LINKSKYNNGISLKNNQQNISTNNNINSNINQSNPPYIKKSQHNNNLEIINQQPLHNESANLNNNKMEKIFQKKKHYLLFKPILIFIYIIYYK